jgi:hypothetical protein
MYQNWIKIKSWSHWYQAEIAKAVLADHQIISLIVNKQDSAYTHIGDVELYVNRDNALRAAHILNKIENEETPPTYTNQ